MIDEGRAQRELVTILDGMLANPGVTRVAIGERVRVRLPHSEVCMHLRVAGQVREVEVLEHGAQILDEDGRRFSFPITHGEAGIFRDEGGLYLP